MRFEENQPRLLNEPPLARAERAEVLARARRRVDQKLKDEARHRARRAREGHVQEDDRPRRGRGSGRHRVVVAVSELRRQSRFSPVVVLAEESSRPLFLSWRREHTYLHLSGLLELEKGGRESN